MTKPVDLDALDAAHAALGPVESNIWFDQENDEVASVLRVVVEALAPPSDDCEPWEWAETTALTTATNAVEILSAYPAMSSELRERRAREEAMAAEIRALRAVRDAAAEVSAYHGVHGTETIQDVNVDALREALAKVPR